MKIPETITVRVCWFKEDGDGFPMFDEEAMQDDFQAQMKAISNTPPDQWDDTEEETDE